MASSSEELTIYGFLREMLNNDRDYMVIIAIIIEFFHQGYAKYFDERLNKEFIKEMRFGDIVRTLDGHDDMDFIKVLNKTNTLEYVGEFYRNDNDIVVEIVIPLSICRELTNATLFFSKFDQNERYPTGTSNMKLHISHDDGFIIDKLGGPLKSEYRSIEYSAVDHNFTYLTIEFMEDTYIDLYPDNIQRFNYEDIIKYHEIRLNKNNMIKIRVKYVGKGFHAYFEEEGIVPISNLWEFVEGEVGSKRQYYI